MSSQSYEIELVGEPESYTVPSHDFVVRLSFSGKSVWEGVMIYPDDHTSAFPRSDIPLREGVVIFKHHEISDPEKARELISESNIRFWSLSDEHHREVVDIVLHTTWEAIWRMPSQNNFISLDFRAKLFKHSVFHVDDDYDKEEEEEKIDEDNNYTDYEEEEEEIYEDNNYTDYEEEEEEIDEDNNYTDYEEEGEIEEDSMDLDDEEGVYYMVPATELSIGNLERKKVRVEGSGCPVCLEEFPSECEVVRLPCSHDFHGDCIEKWLRTSHYCPMCRFEMPTSELESSSCC